VFVETRLWRVQNNSPKANSTEHATGVFLLLPGSDAKKAFSAAGINR
jgi:hypothetical protein